MLNKYDFTNKDDVIDQPSILKITSDQVQIIHAGGTSPDTKEIPEEGLVIQIGNIDSFIPPTPDPIDPDDPVDPTPTPTPDPDPDPSPDPDPDPQPSGDGNISFTLVNNCGYEVRLSGEAILNLYSSLTASSYTKQINVNWFGEHSADWTNNSLVIPTGGSYSWSTTIDNTYLNGNYYIQKNNNPYSASNPNYGSPLFIYSKYFSKSKQSEALGNGMYFTNIQEGCALQSNQTYIFTVYAMRNEAMLADTNTTVSSFNTSGKSYAILYKGQTSLPQ